MRIFLRHFLPPKCVILISAISFTRSVFPGCAQKPVSVSEKDVSST